jgi:UDP-N-acetylmuramate--alanine ligase
MSLNLEHIHRVHCVGVGGIGVSAVAKLLRLQGKEVSGSDAAKSVVTADAEAAGVVVKEESADNVSPDLDVLIYTSAAPETHPERQAAAKFGIPQFSYGEFLGLLTEGRETIAVCGTNGKSSTTAMLGLILEAAGLDPLVIVGSRLKTFPYGNLRPGKGRIFVVEACEHNASFLNLRPTHVVVTNITPDHLDFYRDLDHIRETFQTFIDKTPDAGKLALNSGDPASMRLEPKHRPTTYGLSGNPDYQAKDIVVKDERQSFRVERREPAETWSGMSLGVPGDFNIQNALAAAAMASELGVSEDVIRKTLAAYPGIWRRFERVGRMKNGAELVSDYGHHPDAVARTLRGAKEFFPKRRLVLAFQPHQHDRTRKLFEEFVESFDDADALILSEIYGVEGRKDGEGEISSRDLAEAVGKRDKKQKRERPVAFANDLSETETMIRERAEAGDLILLMGAGSIYTLADTLLQ